MAVAALIYIDLFMTIALSAKQRSAQDRSSAGDRQKNPALLGDAGRDRRSGGPTEDGESFEAVYSTSGLTLHARFPCLHARQPGA
jgi:hypothetical protein